MRANGILIFILAFGYMGTIESTGCPKRLDLVFVVDGSGSIGRHNWMVVQDFLIQVVNHLDVDQDKARVGMVLFSDEARTMWTLNDRTSYQRGRLMGAIRSLPYLDGRTATPAGLLHARRDMFEAPVSRQDAEKVTVVITDGRSNEYTEIFEEQAQLLKNISRVVAIGVTNRIDFEELRLLSTTECDIYTVYSFDAMDDDMDLSMDLICGCIPGYRLVQSTCECLACMEDEYQPHWGQSTCMMCPSGLGTMNSMAAVICQDECPAGSYKVENQRGCELCPVGSFQPNSGSDGCSQCPSGYSTRGVGSTSLSECLLVCNRGEASVTHTDGSMACESCPLGTYQPGTFANMCIDCPAGYSTHQIGSERLEQCLVVCGLGEHPNENGTSCEPCPLGTYQNQTFADSCIRCPEGYSTRQTGSTSRLHCIVVCDPGQARVTQSNGIMSCEPCPIGTFQPESFADGCISCPEGYSTHQPSSTRPEQCLVVCGAGAELTENATKCRPCPIGTYQNLEFEQMCQTCPPGESTREEGATHIDFCEDLNPPGERKNSNPATTAGNAGAIFGAVIGAVLLVVLLVIIIAFILRLRRRKTKDHLKSSCKAPVIDNIENGNVYSNSPDEIDCVIPPSAPNVDVDIYDNDAEPNSTYDNGPNFENPYDNGEDIGNVYNNGVHTENPYDNGHNIENPYDNGDHLANPNDNCESSENQYDNGANSQLESANSITSGNPYVNGEEYLNPYDNGAKEVVVYDNSAHTTSATSTEEAIYDNREAKTSKSVIETEKMQGNAEYDNSMEATSGIQLIDGTVIEEPMYNTIAETVTDTNSNDNSLDNPIYNT